jgi:hypothetical protein
MTDDTHHLQIRTTPIIRQKIRALSESHQRSAADIVRTSLDLGLRILEKLLDAQTEMVEEYITLLKNESRCRIK